MNVSPLSVHHKFKCLVISEVFVNGVVGACNFVEQFVVHSSPNMPVVTLGAVVLYLHQWSGKLLEAFREFYSAQDR